MCLLNQGSLFCLQKNLILCRVTSIFKPYLVSFCIVFNVKLVLHMISFSNLWWMYCVQSIMLKMHLCVIASSTYSNMSHLSYCIVVVVVVIGGNFLPNRIGERLMERKIVINHIEKKSEKGNKSAKLSAFSETYHW